MIKGATCREVAPAKGFIAMRDQTKRGVGLAMVELLIVFAIIGVLIGILIAGLLIDRPLKGESAFQRPR
jgi:competence protein ComGC